MRSRQIGNGSRRNDERESPTSRDVVHIVYSQRARRSEPMVEPDERVIEEARHRGDALLVGELVALIERHHPDERRGVDPDTLATYEEAIAEEGAVPYGSGDVRGEVENRLVDSDTWVNADAFYEVGDGRVSVLPERVHEHLQGETDLRECVRVLEDATADDERGSETGRGGVGTGVPEEVLLDAAAIAGEFDRGEAKERLERLRDEGELVQDADQHPDARVYLDEEVEEMRDDALE